MKRILALLLTAMLLLSLCACGGSDKPAAAEPEKKPAASGNGTTAEAKPSEAPVAPESNEFRITAYTANGQTYEGATIKDLGMEETYLVLEEDHSGYLSLCGEGFEIQWTDDGEIKIAGVTMYSFEYADSDTIDLDMYDTVFTLARTGSAAAEKPAAANDAEPASESGDEPENEPEEMPAASAGTPNEPIAKGDGLAGEEAVLRLMKYYRYADELGMELSYEDMVKVAGVEGKDGGNDGANSMTQYGDRIVFWYISDSSYVYYTFRRPDSEDVWTARQWMSQNIDSAKVDAADISDLMPKADPSSLVENSYSITAFMTDIATKVKVSVPSVNWIPTKDSDTKIALYNTAKEDRNAPQIQIEVQSTLDRINFYLDKYENVQELPGRTIGGIEMAGRSYKNIGWDWVEYYAELPNGVWVSVKITRVEIGDGTEGSLILDSISFD